MEDDQQFCLRWNNHQSTLISVFDTLLENETLVDCTLAAEGKFLKAHKVVLSACSPYFATLLQEQYDKHPIFILKDVKYQELRAMMDYMYRGEVNISQDQLAALLKAAESLQIKGLSDNRSGSGPAAPKPESHHRGKHGGAYTLEQTKRARMTTGGMDAQDVSGSREGSSSPSRRRRKVRRRSMENDAHDNSNSSVLQAAASNQSILQQQSAGLAASALVATQMPGSSGSSISGVASAAANQATNQPLTSTNVTKKTESAKLTSTAAQGIPTAGASTSGTSSAAGGGSVVNAGQQSDAINTENVQTIGSTGAGNPDVDDLDVATAVHTGVVKQLAATIEKSNHKQQQQQQQKNKDNSVSSVSSEMVIEPKAEYDDDAHDENVEDLTLDEEDMTMEELDQTAGTSQGGEGSSQAYATWQHDRSQDELGLMAGQDAQQRDPQVSLTSKYKLRPLDTSAAPSTSKQSSQPKVKERKSSGSSIEAAAASSSPQITCTVDSSNSENDEPQPSNSSNNNSNDADFTSTIEHSNDAMIALQQLASISTARSLRHIMPHLPQNLRIDSNTFNPGRKLPRQSSKRTPPYESNRCPLCARVYRSQAFLNEHMRKEHSVLI